MEKKCEREIYKGLELDLKIIFAKSLLGNSNYLDWKKVEKIRDKLDITNSTKNPEVLSIWFTILVKYAPEVDTDEIKSFLGSYGRLKFIRPIYVCVCSF